MHQPQVPAQANIQDRETRLGIPQSREEGHPSTENHTPESRNNSIPTEMLDSKAPSRGQQPLERGHNDCYCPGKSEGSEVYPWT